MPRQLNSTQYCTNTLFDKILPQYVRRDDTKDTIVSLPEEKANSWQRDSECWRVPGACTYIVTDDGVTSMMNDF